MWESFPTADIEANKIRADGLMLRNDRVKADYHLTASISKRDAEKALKVATRIIAAVSRLP